MNNDALVDAVLASGVVLPAPGPGFLKLRTVAADENAGPRELAAAVSDDPALTGALLRVANSPVFRPRHAPRSAFEAITMLGRTRTLATAASLALRAQSDGMDARIVDQVWANCARAAEFTYAAARATPFRSLADSAYLAALMQDAGLAVVLKRSPENAHLLTGDGPTLEAGARALDVMSGTDHAAAGYLVARNWKLPPEICDAIRAHQDPHLARRLNDEARRLTWLMAAGRRVRDGVTPDWVDWADGVAIDFGLDEGMLDVLGQIER